VFLGYTVHKVCDYHAADSDVTSRGHDDVISVTSLENSSDSNCTINTDSISSDAGSMVLDGDCVLVPSYSQALLMDTRALDGHKTDRCHHHHHHHR